MTTLNSSIRVVIAPRSLNLPHGNTSIKKDTRAENLNVLLTVVANYFNLDTSTEITKRNILEKDCIYVAPGIAAECLQQNEQGHSMKKNTVSQIRPLFVDLKHLMMQSHVQKNSKGRLTMTNI